MGNTYSGKTAIQMIIKMRQVKVDLDTWTSYYLDEKSNTFFILEYPDSGQHGGGVPRLRELLNKDLSLYEK